MAARVAQVDEVLAAASQRRDAVAAHCEALRARVRDRVWLPPTVSAQWLHDQQQTVDLLAALAARLAAIRAGFAALPIDAHQAAEVPKPIDVGA